MKKHNIYKEKRIRLIRSKDKLNNNDLHFLYNLSKSKSMFLKIEAAELLVTEYTAVGEDILYNLTFDKNILVKINAIDSLCIGRSLKSCQRLEYLAEEKDYLVRGYAILSHFEVYMNCFGYSEENRDNYAVYIREKLSKEKNIWVIIVLNQILYYCGVEEGLNVIIKLLLQFVEDNDIELLWVVLHTLEELVDDDNKDKILKAVTDVIDKVIPAQKHLIENFNNTNLLKG